MTVSDTPSKAAPQTTLCHKHERVNKTDGNPQPAVNQPLTFSDDMVEGELDRRDQADADISILHEPERTKRQLAENEWRAKWDEWRDFHDKVPKNVGSQSSTSSCPD